MLLLGLGAAKADVVTFDVAGSYIGIAPTTDGTFAGTLAIDVTAGTLLSADIQALGQDLTFIGGSEAVNGGWRFDIEAGDLDLVLVFPGTTNPHSLVGFAGATIGDGFIGRFVAGPPGFVFLSTTVSGTLAPAPGPVVGAGLPGLTLALGGLLTWSRRRRPAT